MVQGCGREGCCSILRGRGLWVRGKGQGDGLGLGWEGGFELLAMKSDVLISGEEKGGLPSSIPRPERRIGTIETFSGEMVVVVYSYPKGVLLCVRGMVVSICSYWGYIHEEFEGRVLP
jgi:hypothetical protein